MLLPTQIQAILYHFMIGWLYALGFSFLVTFLKYIRFPFIRGLMEIVYHILFTSLMFYGLYHINGGMTNIYLILIFLVGVCIYYAFYLAVFLNFFYRIKRFLQPIRRKIRVVKSKIIAIIRVPRNKMRRRRANAKEKRRARDERKKQKKKTSDEDIL